MALAWLRKRKDKYEGRFSRLEALVSALGSENRGLGDLIKASALQIEHDKLVERVAALRGDHDNVSAEHNSLAERVAALRGDHDNISAEHNRLAERVAALRGDHDNISAEHNRLAERVAALRGDHDNISAEHNRLVERVAALRGDHDNISAEHNRLVERVAALRGDHDNISAEHNRLVERVAGLRGDHDNISAEHNRALPGTAEEQAQKFETRKSYSIEAEDLLLETVFCVVLKQYGPGTYLDVGAAHPVQHSNTYFFYERGWRGTCVEPNPEFYDLYKVLRPRDQALNVGVAKHSGSLRYHRFAHPLINGFYGQDLVDRHVASGEIYLGSSDVPCLSVDELLNTKIDAPVDLLNIDVETLDAELLAAWNWQICRPKVVCAEIHTPSIESMLEFDVAKILRAAGYTAMCRGWLSAIFVDGNLTTTEPWNT